MFGSVQDQQEFVQRFLDASKDVNKEFRKVVLTHKRAEAKANKPPRAARAKKVKPAAESEVENSDADVTPAPKPKGKGRGKKAAPASLENDFVAEIVSLAQGQETHSSPNQGTDSSPNPSFAEAALVEEVQESLPVAGKKEKAEKPVKEKKEKVVKDKKEKVVKEKKEKPVKEKKEKPQKATPPPPASAELETETELELEVEPFQLNGVEYLLDDNGFLYHPESFDKLGSLSHDKLSIIPL